MHLFFSVQAAEQQTLSQGALASSHKASKLVRHAGFGHECCNRHVQQLSAKVCFFATLAAARSVTHRWLLFVQVRRPDDYDAKKVADLGPSEPSSSLNSLVLAQLKRPPPPPPEPEAPPAPAPALPLATPQGAAPVAGRDVEDGEVGGGVPVTRVLKLEHMVSAHCWLDPACSASVQS